MMNMMMSRMMAEDCGAPELRNPRHCGMKPGSGWLYRLLARIVRK